MDLATSKSAGEGDVETDVRDIAFANV